MGVFSKRVAPEDIAAAKAVYMTQQAGLHKVCVSCVENRWFQSMVMKWELSVEHEDHAVDAATKGDLHGLERIVEEALSRAEAMSAENEYEKDSEMEFKTTS